MSYQGKRKLDIWLWSTKLKRSNANFVRDKINYTNRYTTRKDWTLLSLTKYYSLSFQIANTGNIIYDELIGKILWENGPVWEDQDTVKIFKQSLSRSSAFPEDKIQFFFFHIYVFLRDDVFENFNEYLLSITKDT